MAQDIYDFLIVGAGGVGCAIARELSRYDVKIGVLEKGSDVASGTSGRNSAVCHAGFNNKVGSLMAKLCVEGNENMEALCKDLDVPYNKTGKILVAFNEQDIQTLKDIIKQGEANGCKGLRLLSQEEVDKILPGVGGIGGMLSPNTAIFNPFIYTVALAENAHANGASFFFNNEVTAISKESDGTFKVTTSKDTYRSKYLINSAGLFSDKVSSMAGVDGYHIYPCRGEYLILDVDKKNILPLPVYPAPQKGIGGLGVHLTPTTDGNIIIGPSAEYIDDKEDYASTSKIMAKLKKEADQLLPGILDCKIIGSYCGLRSKQAPASEGGFRDFTIKEEPSVPGLINLIGIESPGLTASVPIAKYVINIIKNTKTLTEKPNFIATRTGIKEFRKLSEEEQAKLILEDPEYGDIVCRCQKVSRKEIRQAIENPLGVKTISAIKYRAWPTTGRCNGGYCLQKIAQMLVNDYGFKPEDICYRNEGSELFTGEVK